MKKLEKRFTNVAVLDCCLPDYFTCYHMPVVAVYTYKGMTTKDLARDIKSAINQDYEYLCNDDGGYTEKEMKLFDVFANKLARQKKEVLKLEFCDCADSDECDCETAIYYFGLCKPVNRYGLQFLNE